MENGDNSIAVDADDNDDYEEEDEELRLKNEKECRNKLDDAFESDVDEEVNDYDENEDRSYKPYDENSEELSKNYDEHRLNYQQSSVDERFDQPNSNEDIRRKASEFYFQEHPNGREGENQNDNNQYSEENVGENVYTENELSNNFHGNGDSQDFLDDGNNGNVIKLKSLCAAKDRQIENLDEQLAYLTHRWQTQNEALMQQLHETEVNRDRCISELEECNVALVKANSVGLQLQGRLENLESENAALDQNRNEIFTELTAAEATIEGLRDQVNGLMNSESMMRARDNHLKTINNLSENHRKEILNYNQEIDFLKENFDSKEEEVKILREELDNVRSELAVVQLDKVASVNKLIKDLEVSQENYQKLMKSKNERISEDEKLLIKHLKEELTSVKQELAAYRKASKLSANSSPKLENVSSDGLPPYSQDNLLSLLKNEVELAMKSNIIKNNELKKIKGDLLTSESNVRHFREQALENENLLLESQEKIKTLTNELNQSKLAKDASSSAILRDLETLKKQKESLKVELQESKKKVKELTAHKEEMSEAIKKEWEKKIKMDEEHERDKDAALNECKEYYSNLQSDSNKLEREKAAKNLQDLKQQYEARIKKLMDESNEVKTLYMNVCKEKDGIYERSKAEWEVQKNKLKESWDKEKNFEVQTSKRKLSEEMSKQVAEKVKQAKQLWEKEQTSKFQENVWEKAKEMLEHFQTEKTSDSAENEIDANLEHIKELEARVKETEEAFRNTERQKAKEIGELKAKLRSEHEIILRDVTTAIKTKFEREKASFKATLENVKELMAKEFEERKEAEKLQEMQDLEHFVSTQKERFVSTLNEMQERHTKEKTELSKKYDDIVSQQKEEHKARLDAKDAELQRWNREQLVKYQKERNSLLADIESLTEKCARLENHKTSLATKFQLEVKTAKLELEECKSKLEQTELDWASRHEQQVVNPLRKEIAVLRAKASSAEDVSAQLRLQLEALTIAYKELNDKYAFLKERAKKHDRYVRAKTKEYAANVVKMNAAYQSIFGKLFNEEKVTEDNDIAGSNNGPRTPKMFHEQPQAHESEAEMLKKLKTAIELLQDLCDRLKDMSGEEVDAAPPASKQTSVYGGSRSGTATPEVHTNGSSGRGTMVGNSAGSASEGGGGNERICRTNGGVTNKPLKFWSSTPFNQCQAPFGNSSKTPVPLTTPMNCNCRNNSQKDKISDEWGVSFKGSKSQKKVNSEEDSLTKLDSLTKQILADSRLNFVTGSPNKPTDSRSHKKQLKSAK